MIQQLSNIHDKVCMHKRTALYRAIKSREGQTKISGCRLGITHVNPVQAAIETGSEQWDTVASELFEVILSLG